MNFDINICKQIITTAQTAYNEGLMTATSGNLSVYVPEQNAMAITPSGVRYDRLSPEDIVWINLDGEKLNDNSCRPSSEWKMHAVIYKNIPDIKAIVHTHSPYATAFAVLHHEIPCVLVETLLFLNGSVEVADYARQGSEEVGTNALHILNRKPAALLGNHGVVTVGDSLSKAFDRAQYVEDSAKIVQLAMSTGLPISEEIH